MSSLDKLNDTSYNFFVVEFGDGYELVPRNWIKRETSQCYWPHVLSSKNYDRAVEAMEVPKSSWQLFSIKKIIARARSFGRGKEKLKEAATRSDLSTDADNAMKEKRTRHSRAIKRPNWSSSSSSSHSDEDDNSIPPLPKIPASIIQEEVQEKVSKRSEEEPPVKNRKKELASSNWCRPASGAESPKDQSDGFKTILRAIGGIKFTLSTLLANQDEIKNRIERLEAICKKENEVEFEDDVAENVLTLLPLKCDNDLKILEDNINIKLFKKQLVMELKKIGGNELKNVVYNLLPKLFTNEMAEKYSWHGAKGKRALTCSNLSGLIKDIVRCHFNDATDMNIEVPVKKWLSKAKEKLQRDATKKQSGLDLLDENDNRESIPD